MSITRLRTEVDKLKSATPNNNTPEYSDTELACKLASLILRHRYHPNPDGARVLEILNAASLRAAGLI